MSHSILLVEDTKVASMLATAILKDLGCTVDLAETGAQAFELFSKNNYDLVFMDIGLPDTDGITVTEGLKHHYGEKVRVVAITAHNNNEIRQKCLEAGMLDFLVKPLIAEQVQDVFSKYLLK